MDPDEEADAIADAQAQQTLDGGIFGRTKAKTLTDIGEGSQTVVDYLEPEA